MNILNGLLSFYGSYTLNDWINILLITGIGSTLAITMTKLYIKKTNVKNR